MELPPPPRFLRSGEQQKVRELIYFLSNPIVLGAYVGVLTRLIPENPLVFGVSGVGLMAILLIQRFSARIADHTAYQLDKSKEERTESLMEERVHTWLENGREKRKNSEKSKRGGDWSDELMERIEYEREVILDLATRSVAAYGHNWGTLEDDILYAKELICEAYTACWQGTKIEQELYHHRAFTFYARMMTEQSEFAHRFSYFFSIVVQIAFGHREGIYLDVDIKQQLEPYIRDMEALEAKLLSDNQ